MATVTKQVKVAFEGTITVEIPSEAENLDLLAIKLALALVQAILEPDENASVSAYEEYEEECTDHDKSQASWDAAKATAISGAWETHS